MKKLVYSDLDSNNGDNLKPRSIYSPDNGGLFQRLPLVNTLNENSIEFLPSILDGDATADNSTFNLKLGSRVLNFSSLSSGNFILSISGQDDNNAGRITYGVNTHFTNSFTGIHFGNGDYLNKHPVKWTLIASRNLTDTAIPLPPGYATVADLMSGAIEGMLVAKIGNEYVSTVIPAAAIDGYPATFPIHKAGSEVASFTFNAATDTTYSITVGGADNVKVFMR